MIKLDKIGVLKEEKKITICFGVICLIMTIYTALFTLGAVIWNKYQKKKSVLSIIYGVIMLIAIVYIRYTQYNFVDFFTPYLEYSKYLFLLDPVRTIIAASFGIWFLYKGHLLSEGVDDWVIQEKKEKMADLIPPGKFSFDNREHMLLFGTTGAGKGVTLNHIIHDIFRKNIILVMISAKLASTDPYSQLQFVRKMAERYKRKLYIVSMDTGGEDKCIYNPFKYITPVEMQNALINMIESDSHFYKTNFVAWVMAIFKAIRAAGEEVTLNKILDLYDYKDFVAYVKKMASRKKITDPGKFLNRKINNYATNAKNDAANLDLIYEAGEEVFGDGKDSISLRDAIQENAVIYFDLNGVSSKAATSLIGACITAEIQHAAMEFNDPAIEKTIICDEASFYISEMFVSCFALARSAGYKFIISTQGPSDLCGPQNNDKILSQLINNSNQFGVLRINSPKDAEDAAEVIGTVMESENTRRVDGIDYEGTGSLKAVPVLAANPTTIKYLRKREMIYLEKSDNENHEPRPMMVRWRLDDLE